MAITSAEAPQPEELEQFEADIPEVVVEPNETPVELSTQLQAEVLAQTDSFSKDVITSTQHSIEVIGLDPDIIQQPEMVELMDELERLAKDTRELGENTNNELASAVEGESENETLINSSRSKDVNRAIESEPTRETPKTVKQLIDNWKTEYDACEDPDIKSELAYRMVKMSEALRAAQLNADEVGIQSLDGATGFYDFNTKKTFITPTGIEEPEHFKHIMVHEAIHAGKITGKRIADEGLTEIATKKQAGENADGVYEKEQAQTRKTLTKMDMAGVLDSYDFDHPEELITLYLQTVWKDEWEKITSELQPGETIFTESGRNELLQNRLRTWTSSLEHNLQNGLPDLVSNAKRAGFNFDQANAKLFKKLVDREIGETKRMEVGGVNNSSNLY